MRIPHLDIYFQRDGPKLGTWKKLAAFPARVFPGSPGIPTLSQPCALIPGLLSDHGDGRAHGASVSAEVHDYVPPASVGRA